MLSLFFTLRSYESGPNSPSGQVQEHLAFGLTDLESWT